VGRYEFSGGTSNKFWEIQLEGKTLTTTYGRIGSDGQSTTKSFASEEQAKKEHDKLVAEKVKKGYTLIGEGGAKVRTKAADKKPAPKKAAKKRPHPFDRAAGLLGSKKDEEVWEGIQLGGDVLLMLGRPLQALDVWDHLFRGPVKVKEKPESRFAHQAHSWWRYDLLCHALGAGERAAILPAHPRHDPAEPQEQRVAEREEAASPVHEPNPKVGPESRAFAEAIKAAKGKGKSAESGLDRLIALLEPPRTVKLACYAVPEGQNPREGEIRDYLWDAIWTFAILRAFEIGREAEGVRLFRIFAARYVEEPVFAVHQFFQFRPCMRALADGELAGLIEPDDAALAHFRAALEARLAKPGGEPSKAKPVGWLPWRPLLEKLSKKVLASEDLAARLPSKARKARWLGFDGASSKEIVALEKRLGKTLPDSYRSFLETSNGWLATGPFIERLLPAAEVKPFAEENKEWVDIYAADADAVSVEDHATWRGDCVHFRPAYLEGAVQISAVGDSAVMLLVPEVQDANGEWEAWFFASWLPGADRFPSFRELMENELARGVDD
jgi:predicted DNA-binding WGR domain protein